MLLLCATVEAYAMNTFAFPSLLSIFSSFKLASVWKPPDILNLAFTPLGEFTNIQNDHLQLLNEKTEFIAHILLEYKKG